jgi:hypothetical protein
MVVHDLPVGEGVFRFLLNSFLSRMFRLQVQKYVSYIIPEITGAVSMGSEKCPPILDFL